MAGPRSIEIAVEDDGDGFDPALLGANGAARRGFGLMGIHERVRMLGGRVEIRSGAGTGTTVMVSLPVHEVV